MQDGRQIVGVAGKARFGRQGGQSVNVVSVTQTAALGDALRAGDIQPYVDRFGTGYVP